MLTQVSNISCRLANPHLLLFSKDVASPSQELDVVQLQAESKVQTHESLIASQSLVCISGILASSKPSLLATLQSDGTAALHTDSQECHSQIPNATKSNTGIISDYFVLSLSRVGRRQRCFKCKGCKAHDCGECIYCLDKRKFGGPGKKKQCCVKKICTNMSGNTKADINQKVMSIIFN